MKKNLRISSMDNLRDRAMSETVYGAGPRLSEITYLRVQDIDSQQMRIFVHHGKGGKDRYTLLSKESRGKGVGAAFGGKCLS